MPFSKGSISGSITTFTGREPVDEQSDEAGAGDAAEDGKEPAELGIPGQRTLGIDHGHQFIDAGPEIYFTAACSTRNKFRPRETTDQERDARAAALRKLNHHFSKTPTNP